MFPGERKDFPPAEGERSCVRRKKGYTVERDRRTAGEKEKTNGLYDCSGRKESEQ